MNWFKVFLSQFAGAYFPLLCVVAALIIIVPILLFLHSMNKEELTWIRARRHVLSELKNGDIPMPEALLRRIHAYQKKYEQGFWFFSDPKLE